MAYQEDAHIHNVFYVSQLPKAIGDMVEAPVLSLTLTEEMEEILQLDKVEGVRMEG